MCAWYMENGPESDVVVSSRVRLARNINKYPFPSMMNREQQHKVVEESKDAILDSRSPISKEFSFIDINRLDVIEKQSMVEKHLISPDIVSITRECGVLLSRDERISIMINEEDHLRIQCLFSGFRLDNALDYCTKIDSLMEEKIEYACHDRLGYLTSCPSNLGTGMRASVMMHLPALTMTGYINGVIDALGKMGIAVRGIYGEHSEASGSMFQISNQVSLGLSEDEIVSNLQSVILQVIERERSIRNELYKQGTLKFEDRIWRTYGTFTNARIMTSEECMKMISDIKLGIFMGIIKNISIDKMNELMILTQPATLQRLAGKALTPDERDYMRANIVREKLGL